MAIGKPGGNGPIAGTGGTSAELQPWSYRRDENAPADYPALFRQYAVRSAQVTLDRVRAHEGSFVGAPQEQVFQALDFAMQLDEAWPWVKDVLLTIAPQMVQAGYQDGWAPYLMRGIDLAHARNNGVTAAELQLNLGWLLQMRGDFDAAARHYEESVTAFESLNMPNGVARALSRKAYVACIRNDYENAHRAATRSLALFSLHDPDRAAALNSLGRIAFFRQNYQEAVDYYEQALAIRAVRGEQFLVASNLRDLGLARLELRDVDGAVDCFNRGLAIFQDLRADSEVATMLNNLGNAYCETGRFDEAQQYYADARDLHIRRQDDFGLAVATFNIGYAFVHMQQYEQAKAHFLVALQFWRTLRNRYMRAECLRYLGDIHVKANHRRRATVAYTQALRALDGHESTSNAESLKDLLRSKLGEVQ